MSLPEYWEPITESGCQIWTGSVDEKGYGLVTIKRRTRRAHRIAWELTYGPIPNGLFVCHKCDVKSCINPQHLFLGTTTDNIRDAAKKGRMAHGEAHSSAKLTAAQVVEIRQSGESQYKLAKFYGVSPQSINAVKRRLTWSRV